ncbi:ferredoxin, partial [Chloroflexota bacterium]
MSVPVESMTTPQRIQVAGLEVMVELEPLVKAYHLTLQAPSLANPQADSDQLLGRLNQQYQLGCAQIDIDLLRNLSPQLRSWDWQCQATVRHHEVIAVAPWPSRQPGLAVDLGTTKIAGYLVDLNGGQTLAAK